MSTQHNETPEGARSQGDFFDLMGAEGEQFKKKEKRPEQKNPERGRTGGARPEPKKYAEGTEIHQYGHKLTLPREMTEQEVYEFVNDDFPDITRDRSELRYDEKKGRIFFQPKGFKKGAAAGGAITVLREPPTSRGSYPPSSGFSATTGSTRSARAASAPSSSGWSPT